MDMRFHVADRCNSNLHHMQVTARASKSPAAVAQPRPDRAPADEGAVAHVRTEADTDDRGSQADVNVRPQHGAATAEPQQPQVDAGDSESLDGSVAASSSAAAEAEEPFSVQLLTEDAPAVAAAAHAAGVDGESAASVVDGPRSAAKSKVVPTVGRQRFDIVWRCAVLSSALCWILETVRELLTQPSSLTVMTGHHHKGIGSSATLRTADVWCSAPASTSLLRGTATLPTARPGTDPGTPQRRTASMAACASGAKRRRRAGWGSSWKPSRRTCRPRRWAVQLLA